MFRVSALIGVLVALAVATPAVAATPHFVVVAKNGTTESLSYFGYTFGVSAPPLGRSGTIQVDCLAPDQAALEKLLPVGAVLKSAELVISAELPHPQHYTFHFENPTVKAVLYLHGHFGPSASITISFTRLTK